MELVRNDKGQFEKGVSGNPAGRPKREVEKAYLDATIGKVSLDDWAVIVAKAVEQAKTGDGEARKWLSEYLLGKPTQQIDITGTPGGVIEVQWAYLAATSTALGAGESEPGNGHATPTDR